MRFYICEVMDERQTRCIFTESSMRPLWKRTGGDIARCIRHGALITNEMEAPSKRDVQKVWHSKESAK